MYLGVRPWSGDLSKERKQGEYLSLLALGPFERNQRKLTPDLYQAESYRSVRLLPSRNKGEVYKGELT